MTLRTRARRAMSRAKVASGTAIARHGRRLDNQARRLHRLEQQSRQYGERITELEAELQEARRLNKRIAELTDVVAEVLLPADQRDDARIASLLGDYRDTFRQV